MRWGTIGLLAASLVTLLPAGPGVAAATRQVTVAVGCEEGAALALAVTNLTGAPLHVALARALVAPRGPSVAELDIPDRRVQVLSVGRGGGTVARPEGALVVTSAGLLVARCGGPPAALDLGPPPGSADEAAAEGAAVAARTIAELEGLRAFDALYALLHPDAKAVVSPRAMACWYAGQLAATTAGAATVTGVAFGRWTWSVTGATYPNAATITYAQTYATAAGREERSGSEHLVLAGGQWRWFLGHSRAWLDRLPTACPNAGDATA